MSRPVELKLLHRTFQITNCVLTTRIDYLFDTEDKPLRINPPMLQVLILGQFQIIKVLSCCYS